jgi:hypothetical protein
MTQTKAISGSSPCFGHLVIGAWSLFVIWCMLFEISGTRSVLLVTHYTTGR